MDRLETAPPEAERQALAQRSTDRIDLHNLLLLGRYHWNKFTLEDTRKCQGYFEEAIRLDPTYAPAHAGMAMLYLQFGGGGLDTLPASAVVPKVREAAQRALALDPANAEAHRALATSAIFHERDWPSAAAHSKKALELGPGAGANREPHAFYLSAGGRHSEALREIEYALEVDPLSPLTLQNAAYHSYLARDFEKARRYCERCLALDPNFAWGHMIAGMVHCQSGSFDEAIATFEHAAPLGAVSNAYLGFVCGCGR